MGHGTEQQFSCVSSTETWWETEPGCFECCQRSCKSFSMFSVSPRGIKFPLPQTLPVTCKPFEVVDDNENLTSLVESRKVYVFCFGILRGTNACAWQSWPIDDQLDWRIVDCQGTHWNSCQKTHQPRSANIIVSTSWVQKKALNRHESCMHESSVAGGGSHEEVNGDGGGHWQWYYHHDIPWLWSLSWSN